MRELSTLKKDYTGDRLEVELSKFCVIEEHLKALSCETTCLADKHTVQMRASSRASVSRKSRRLA